jgi:Cu/Zn superoxide dismutase
MTGLTLSEMEGRVFVVHELTGGRIACGILSGSSLTTGVSTLSAYPGYTGGLDVSGTVTIRAATDYSAIQTLDWDLEGIDPSCTSGAGDGVPNGCGIHVHEGTSCAVAADVGGHYYNSTLHADPWADSVYVASGKTSSGSRFVMTGLRLSDLVGRAFVVHELTSGARIACGILESAPTMMSVSSGISQYPGYDGDLQVTGVVTLTGDTIQTLKWDLSGLDTACVSGAGDSVPNGCGIHVHEGESCDVAAGVGGHYYSTNLNYDPWVDVVYVSDNSGMSSGSTMVNTGLMLWDLAGRAFVIHELTNGARIACGVLVAGEVASVANFASYPGYTGNLTVAGKVDIASSGVVSQVLTWDLTGVDTNCTYGAGDDVPNGCGIHVHSGSTCAMAADVGGHLYSPSLASDPWADIVYVANSSRASMGAVEVVTGLTLADQVGKAFVVHELTGARVACSIVDEAPCADDDAEAIALASGIGYRISGCADVKAFCKHGAYGSVVQATCPETCGLCTPCSDDDAKAIALASGVGYTISGCVDVKAFCEHGVYGSVVQATCPATCGSCTRRLADGKNTNADELDWVEGLTVPAAEFGQKAEELSTSDTHLFYP